MFENVRVLCPDGFRAMSEEEVRGYFGGDLPRFGLFCPEKHIILTIGKTKKSILNYLTDSNSVLSGAERAMRGLPEYRCLKRFDSGLLGKAAKGIRFSFAAKDLDVKQYGEMRVAKVKGRFYISTCLARLEDQKESEPLFEEFCDSLELE